MIRIWGRVILDQKNSAQQAPSAKQVRTCKAGSAVDVRMNMKREETNISWMGECWMTLVTRGYGCVTNVVGRDGTRIDRGYNWGRRIYLRALGYTPTLREMGFDVPPGARKYFTSQRKCGAVVDCSLKLIVCYVRMWIFNDKEFAACLFRVRKSAVIPKGTLPACLYQGDDRGSVR